MAHVILMEEFTESPRDAVRRSIPLFKRSVMLDQLCWPCNAGAFCWVLYTPGLGRHLSGEPIEDPDEYDCDYQYARGWRLDHRPPDSEFHAVPREWTSVET